MLFYKIVAGTVMFLAKIVFRFKIEGKENIPKEGGAILCANHIHFIDAVTLAACTKRQVHFITKKELFENKLLGFVLKNLGGFPVDRSSKMDIKAFRTAINILKEEKVLGIFFEGTRNAVFDSENAKSGVALFAIKGKAPIVPVRIVGNYKPFVSKVKVYIGKPISLDEHYGKKVEKETLKEVVTEISNRISQLG